MDIKRLVSLNDRNNRLLNYNTGIELYSCGIGIKDSFIRVGRDGILSSDQELIYPVSKGLRAKFIFLDNNDKKNTDVADVTDLTLAYISQVNCVFA